VSRDDALTILREHLPELRARFGVASIALFGSTARDEAGLTSDVDVLVSFAEGVRVGLFELVDLKAYLETLLEHDVDIVTFDGLRDDFDKTIQREAVYV